MKRKKTMKHENKKKNAFTKIAIRSSHMCNILLKCYLNLLQRLFQSNFINKLWCLLTCLTVQSKHKNNENYYED